jgi:hypothetical protein
MSTTRTPESSAPGRSPRLESSARAARLRGRRGVVATGLAGLLRRGADRGDGRRVPAGGRGALARRSPRRRGVGRTAHNVGVNAVVRTRPRRPAAGPPDGDYPLRRHDGPRAALPRPRSRGRRGARPGGVLGAPRQQPPKPETRAASARPSRSAAASPRCSPAAPRRPLAPRRVRLQAALDPGIASLSVHATGIIYDLDSRISGSRNAAALRRADRASGGGRCSNR